MFRGSIEAGGSPSWEEAQRGDHEETHRISGEEVATHGKSGELAEGTNRRGAVGSPDSSQGAEPMHGLRSAPIDSGTGGEAGGRTLVPRRPQQHEACRHFGPQLQWRACSSASKLADGEGEEADTAPVQPIPKSSTTTGMSQR